MSGKQSSQSLSQIQTLLTEYAREANQWAHFSERNTALNAERFVQMLVLGWLKDPSASLNQLAQAGQALGSPVTGAALHERMDQAAVMLLASVLTLALEGLHSTSPLALTKLQQFPAIYITDSSQIALPAALAPYFRGNQDNSMVKLQVVWDYLHGHLAALELTEGRQPDQRCHLHLGQALAGSLHVFDLGYFKQEHLRDIDQQGCFFVCRYQSQTRLYRAEADAQCWSVQQWLRGLSENTAQCRLLLGERVKLPLRLVVRRLPAQAAAARRRKAKRKARKQGKPCSANYRWLLGWDLLVTNLPAEQWSLEQVLALYPIRSQIEWVFRTWKDQLGMDELGNWRVERVLCQLYAHLLGALLCHLLTAAWRWREREYSWLKAVQIIQRRMGELLGCLARQGRGCQAWLKRLERDFQRFALKTQRRKSPSTLQQLHNWGLS
jgi:hypothetical protein